MSDHETIAPHGGTLVDLLATGSEADRLSQEAANHPKLQVNERELSDLEMLAVGALSPLTGFVGEKEYHSILETMHLQAGLPWTIPVTLSLTEDDVKRIGGAEAVTLTGDDGEPLAVLEVGEVFRRDREKESKAVFGTEEIEHPGVKALHDAGDWCLAGDVRVFRLPEHDDFTQYRLKPAETRAEFAKRGWKTVVGFQTRNPIHRAHEYIQKVALEGVDGLLVHPLVGQTKSDDIPAKVRLRCYEVLLRHYYPQERVLLAVMPAAMRYAGPREAVFHALIRRNYGCTHFIVGRDAAGVGNYYGTYDAHRIFSNFAPEAVGITPLFFENSFYCTRCQGMASTKTCPHPESDHVSLSGTKVRELLRAGGDLPAEFSRPEVAAILKEAMQ